MDSTTLKKIRDDARNADFVYIECMKSVEKLKTDAALKGCPYFEVNLDSKISIKTIENILDTLWHSQGFNRIFFSYPTSSGYSTELIKYENDNFKLAVGYGTSLRVYF